MVSLNSGCIRYTWKKAEWANALAVCGYIRFDELSEILRCCPTLFDGRPVFLCHQVSHSMSSLLFEVLQASVANWKYGNSVCLSSQLLTIKVQCEDSTFITNRTISSCSAVHSCNMNPNPRFCVRCTYPGYFLTLIQLFTPSYPHALSFSMKRLSTIWIYNTQIVFPNVSRYGLQ